jgi:hypothetical protein
MGEEVTTVQVGVSEYDIDRSESDPSQCPITRAISKRFRISPFDVDVKGGSVYIWDEWDHPSEVYTFENDAVLNFICSWKAMEVVKPFEFSMKKRR